MTDWLELPGDFGPDLLHVARQLAVADEAVRRAHVHGIRKKLGSRLPALCTKEELANRVAAHVLCDLAGQGWTVRVSGAKISLCASKDQIVPKERVRVVHMRERDAKLREKSVREFVEKMERRRLTATGWHSIFSLMRDGRELSDQLRSSLVSQTSDELHDVLRQAVQPYIQFVRGDETCEHTGLLLREIWRYFRLTWTNVFKTTPGRSMMILVRDSAAPNHPVIGIASLGSSVVQQDLRDKWIGWHPTAFVEEFSRRPDIKKMKRLMAGLDELIDAVLTRDLIKEGLLSRRDIQDPSIEVIERLRAEALRARMQHERYPNAATIKSSTDWKMIALTPLFRSKRCDTLASLLSIRRVLGQEELRTISGLRDALGRAEVRDSLRQLIRRIKGANVGIHQMDITVCGAIAPYNLILGGKLVCMLLTSPEVIQEYSRRYANQASIIASSMKGEALKRTPHLVALFTTSLYGEGSSQYNRVKLPCEALGGRPGDLVTYEKLGLSEGFGSFHFSRSTLYEMSVLLSRRVEGRRVNSIFGEGVNPLMRKIREGLEVIGFPSNQILRHGMPRVIYAVRLAYNSADVLLGLSNRPRYIIPSTKPRMRTSLIADYWRRRWVASRINTVGILDALREHTTAYPVTHGARVSLPAVVATVEPGEFLWNR